MNFYGRYGDVRLNSRTITISPSVRVLKSPGSEIFIPSCIPPGEGFVGTPECEFTVSLVKQKYVCFTTSTQLGVVVLRNGIARVPMLKRTNRVHFLRHLAFERDTVFFFFFFNPRNGLPKVPPTALHAFGFRSELDVCRSGESGRVCKNRSLVRSRARRKRRITAGRGRFFTSSCLVSTFSRTGTRRDGGKSTKTSCSKKHNDDAIRRYDAMRCDTMP